MLRSGKTVGGSISSMMLPWNSPPPNNDPLFVGDTPNKWGLTREEATWLTFIPDWAIEVVGTRDCPRALSVSPHSFGFPVRLAAAEAEARVARRLRLE
jgi:hypothetical protein